MESRRMRGAALALVVSLLWSGVSGGNISVYWGQNADEASLEETCKSGKFEIVMLGFLTMFGNGQTPVLNLTGHCDSSSGGCKVLKSEIETCQSRGIKVFLSLGGPDGKPKITSFNDAEDVATYLWDDYLGGRSGNGPFGDVVLNGIDFAIESPTEFLDDLTTSLSRFGSNVYLSASPQCPYPDAHLNNALQTGLFDYVWVKFYNNASCQYGNGGASNVVDSWVNWTTSVPTTATGSFYLGLPAACSAADSGYIEPGVLISKVLPQIQTSAKYGGVMLWNNYWDEQSLYSSIIKSHVLMNPSLVDSA